ncbi:MAG: hypothetical protein IIC69_00725 [Nanoarchaeota archaeon]|nr:hypothetical protein [Nanoarchaeota archaeon]
MDINELKKDVEAFGKGVERLEQLKAQFDKINTSGHKDEAKEIESMLKNVSAIPELEVKIVKLKNAVQRKNSKYTKKTEFKVKLQQREENILKEKYESELKAKMVELERKNSLYLAEKEKGITDKVKENNLKYLKDKETLIRNEALTNLEKEKELLKDKNELEIQGKIRDMEIKNADYLRNKENELRAENETSGNDFYEKLQDKEKQLKKVPEIEFTKSKVPQIEQTKDPQENKHEQDDSVKHEPDNK